MRGFLVGTLVGVLLALNAPAPAHHGNSYARLQRQIERLQDKTNELDSNGYLDAD